MLKKFCLILAVLYYTLPVAAQQPFCGIRAFDDPALQNNPEFRRLAAIRKLKESNNGSRLYRSPLATPDTIPVVVHVIHTGTAIGTAGNPSDAAINNLIAILNQACSATYPGYPGTNSGGVDLGLYFKLAQKAPGCVATNGIVRVDASADQQYVSAGVGFSDSMTGISHAQLAAKSYWDNTAYFNIWLVNKFDLSWLGGYAFYPTGTQTIYDGVTMLATGISNPYIIAHEIGHSFDLLHTFQGAVDSDCAANDDCSREGDQVCDTEPHLENIGCEPGVVNPCSGNQLGDLVYNYMNYNCHRLFTQGQYARIRSAVDKYRTSLIQSDAKWPPQPIAAPEIAAAGRVRFCEGDSVKLYTTNASPVHWQLNGQVISPAPADLIFARQTGFYKAFSISGQGCRSLDSDSILVTSIAPPHAAVISISGSPDICAGQPVTIFCRDTLNTRWYKDDSLITGAGSNELITTSAGTYFNIKVDNEGCVSPPSNSIVINLYQPNFLGNDTLIILKCINDSVNLEALYAQPGLDFTWNTNHPQLVPAGDYELVATTNEGCMDTVTIGVEFKFAKWIGVIDSDFFTEGNWSTGKIPDEETAVLILANTPHDCILNRGSAKVASVQLVPGTKLFVIPPATLFLLGSCPDPVR